METLDFFSAHHRHNVVMARSDAQGWVRLQALVETGKEVSGKCKVKSRSKQSQTQSAKLGVCTQSALTYVTPNMD